MLHVGFEKEASRADDAAVKICRLSAADLEEADDEEEAVAVTWTRS